jgi:Ni/Co efflux regulator RcnB
MKRFSLTALSAGLGLAMLTAPLAMAQQYDGAHQDESGHHMQAPQHQDMGSHNQMGGYAQGGHQWHNGDHYNGSRAVVSDWGHYHVRRPPSGYEWVHDGNQLVMIAIGTGLVASALANGY